MQNTKFWNTFGTDSPSREQIYDYARTKIINHTGSNMKDLLTKLASLKNPSIEKLEILKGIDKDLLNMKIGDNVLVDTAESPKMIKALFLNGANWQGLPDHRARYFIYSILKVSDQPLCRINWSEGEIKTLIKQKNNNFFNIQFSEKEHSYKNNVDEQIKRRCPVCLYEKPCVSLYVKCAHVACCSECYDIYMDNFGGDTKCRLCKMGNNPVSDPVFYRNDENLKMIRKVYTDILQLLNQTLLEFIHSGKFDNAVMEYNIDKKQWKHERNYIKVKMIIKDNYELFKEVLESGLTMKDLQEVLHIASMNYDIRQPRKRKRANANLVFLK